MKFQIDIKELMNNKMFKMLAMVVASILVLVIVIMLVLSLRVKRVSGYAALEEKMISAAKDYYGENLDALPKEVGGKVEVDSATLTAGKYMKNITDLSPKGSVCSGKVVVKNVNQGYFYQAFVDCGESYQTTTFSNYIKSHVNTVAVGTGLYENGGNYIYRGESPNNYIKFAGRIYRIVQVNVDGTIQMIATEKSDRVVWDDRYNQEREDTVGINDYRVSRLRDTLLSKVNSKMFSDSDRNMLEPFSICLGKVTEDTEVSLGMECSDTLDGQVIGLLPISSYIYASLDATCKTALDGTCQNYNYLETEYNWWTITGDAANTYKAYVVQMNSSAYNTRTASNAVAREVLRLTENSVYVSGDGTLENPYVIK